MSVAVGDTLGFVVFSDGRVNGFSGVSVGATIGCDVSSTIF